MEHVPSPKQNVPEQPDYLTLFDVDRRTSAFKTANPEQKELINSSMLAHTMLATLRSLDHQSHHQKDNTNPVQQQKLETYKQKHPEIAKEVLKMKDLIDAMPMYISLSQIKHSDIDTLWDWYKSIINKSNFLQKQEKETYFSMYYEDYLSGKMPKEARDEFKQFLLQHPSYAEQLDDIRKADERHALKIGNLTTLLGQYHDFSKFTDGEMNVTESNEFIDNILDQTGGSQLLEKLRTMYQEEKSTS
ncbi:MAG: hypothetical protein K9M36_01025 [Candidatus Pacebacteria bacterium]|nr:hypothetical protein [Candidatus Paceibacterota bacterium]